MNYTADRLEQLENETHGELALGTTTTVNGWNVTLLPSSEVVAELTLDYILNIALSGREEEPVDTVNNSSLEQENLE